jgi:hypothetical protein
MKAIKTIDPIKGVLSTFEQIGKPNKFRNEALNTVIGNITVDTVIAFDTHMWETGIEREGKWTIVEQYNNKEEAVKGHNKWVGKIKKNPKIELEDINVWG